MAIRGVPVVVAILIVLTACVPGASLEGPPDLVVRSQDVSMGLEPVSFCWRPASTNICVEQDQADPLPNLGTVEGRIEVEWPVEGWTFVAVFVDPLNREDESTLEVDLIELGEGVWALATGAREGFFEIGLLGYGPQGDVYAVFTADILDQPDLRAPVPFFSFLA